MLICVCCLVSEEKVCCAALTDLIDTTLTCLAAGDDGSDKAGACSDVQGNNSNNLVTGPEGDGLVVCALLPSSSHARTPFLCDLLCSWRSCRVLVSGVLRLLILLATHIFPLLCWVDVSD